MEHAGRSLVKTGEPWPDLVEAEQRVLVMQCKLHRWAVAEPGHRFDDLANLEPPRVQCTASCPDW